MKVTAVVILVLAVMSGLPASAQSVISAHSGLINFTQGPVMLNDRPVQSSFGQLPLLKEQETLRTGGGRAELLLNPGVFLRVGERSSIRMVSNRLTDSKIELVSGTLVVEAAEIEKGSSVALRYQDATISILKPGLYRMETAPARLRVFEGKALVESGGQRVEVKKGKALAFDGSMATTKFSRKEADALDLWSSRRAAYLARVNYATASAFRAQSWSTSTNGWWWNPVYGAYTFMPLRGTAYSPYGFFYLNPPTVHQGYTTYGGGGSYQGTSSPGSSGGPTIRPGSSSGSMGGVSSSMSAPAVMQAPARSAPSSGGGVSAGGRSAAK